MIDHALCMTASAYHVEDICSHSVTECVIGNRRWMDGWMAIAITIASQDPH